MPSDEPAVVEPKAEGPQSETSTERVLRLRVRQQGILAELGVLALQGTPFAELLDVAVRLVADGLEAQFCKVMEFLPIEGCLLVRAGVGWEDGIVGIARVGVDLASPAGFALQTGKPVISNHLEHEQRFRTPELLLRHGVRRAMNVILQGDGSPFGVLEVDSASGQDFGEHDIAFLQGAANLLGMAIERQRSERELKAALDRHEVLLSEVNHRIKNSLQLVASMLHLQASSAGSADVRSQLQEASSRVAAVARAHQSLYRDTRIGTLDLAEYLTELCRDMSEVMISGGVSASAAGPVEISIDRAIPVALIVNELVTNAAKYAYPKGPMGPIRVELHRDGDLLTISVRDDGIGLPADFHARPHTGLGMRIVDALARQLTATIAFPSRGAGTEVTFSFALDRN